MISFKNIYLTKINQNVQKWNCKKNELKNLLNDLVEKEQLSSDVLTLVEDVNNLENELMSSLISNINDSILHEMMKVIKKISKEKNIPNEQLLQLFHKFKKLKIVEDDSEQYSIIYGSDDKIMYLDSNKVFNEERELIAEQLDGELKILKL